MAPQLSADLQHTTTDPKHTSTQRHLQSLVFITEVIGNAQVSRRQQSVAV